MRKRFYIWLWEKMYMRAVSLAHAYWIAGKMTKYNDSIKLQNILMNLKEELVTGEVK